MHFNDFINLFAPYITKTKAVENIIETHQLVKTFNAGKPNEVRPVREVNLQIKENSCVVLKGPSGSGKTTLLTLLSCLAKPTAGKHICMGEHVSRWSEKFLTRFRQQHIGVVFQHFQLVKGFTTAMNVALPLVPQQIKQSKMNQMVAQVVAQVNLQHRLHFKVDNLSGGELQRVAIARALVNNPTIILADEPTAHLDRKLSVNILDIFAALKAQGKTLILTTHDPLVEDHPMVDHSITMQDGVIVSEEK